MRRYYTAEEAADALGVTVATLYSYVSRGLVRSEETEGPTRAKRYVAEDIHRLRQRRSWRQDPTQAARGALRFGSPVLDSALTLIQDGNLYYRGYDALALATERPLEEVAALLWRGSFDTAGLFEDSLARERGDTRFPPTLAGFQAELALSGEEELAAYNLSAGSVARTGARIIQRLVMIATGAEVNGGVAEALQRAWVRNNEEARRVLSAALTLCADHELNVSAFTARCVASAGATPYAVVGAGLAALGGFRHGGHTERVEALFREAEMGAREAIASYGRRGEEIPGFHHPLYPDGDPRCRLLLLLAEEVSPEADAIMTARALVAAMQEATGMHPTVDLGLVTVARALNLPANGALLIFAIGRTAGWIAHAIEQYESERLIRPRARYIGPAPPESGPSD